MGNLDHDLESLQQDIIVLSSRVQEMFEKSCRALQRRDVNLGREVCAQEPQIDDAEVAIEESCLTLLALHRPVAASLRWVATILKINNDLERIADLAVNIAERTSSLALLDAIPTSPGVDRMVSGALQMVNTSIDSLIKRDTNLAKQVIDQDDQVDADNREVITQIYEMVKSQPLNVEAALHFFSAVRHIERVADHATNIAEDVIYLVDGEIARHKKNDD